jgi:hypothetical protein
MQALSVDQVKEVNGGVITSGVVFLIGVAIATVANAHLIDAFYGGVLDGATSAKK